MGLLLSIEIEKQNIKIVEASKNGEMLSILNCLTFKAPLNITEGNINEEDIDCFASVIKKELDINNIKAKKAIFVINSSSIITRKLKLPLLKKSSETLSMIKNELEQLISTDLNQYKIIYKVVKNADNEINNAYYTVYCLPLSIYDRYYELSNKLNLNLVCLDTPFNCLNKIFAHNIKINSTALNLENIYAFVNIDTYWCYFCVLNNGVNDFYRISVIDEFREAEIVAEKEGYYKSNNFPHAFVNMSMLLEEISKSIRYYYSIDNVNCFNKIFIFGDCLEINDISKYLYENLNIEVSQINTVSNMQFGSGFSSDNSFANNYFNPILSLFNNKNDIYFCKETKNDYKNSIKKYVPVITIASIIIAGSSYTLSYSNDLLKNKINDFNNYIKDENNIEINSQIEKIKNDNLKLEELLKEIEALKDIVNNNDYVSSYALKEIYESIPLNTKITSISIDGNNTQLTCVSDSIEEVTLFIQRLRKVKYFDNIHVPNVEVNQDYLNYSYSIICSSRDVNNNDY